MELGHWIGASCRCVAYGLLCDLLKVLAVLISGGHFFLQHVKETLDHTPGIEVSEEDVSQSGAE